MLSHLYLSGDPCPLVFNFNPYPSFLDIFSVSQQQSSNEAYPYFLGSSPDLFRHGHFESVLIAIRKASP